MKGNEEISSKFIQAFLELRVDNKGIRFLLESSPFGIALIDHNKRYISVNHNFANSIGYTIEEAEGLSYEELTCPLFFELDDNNYHRMVNGDIDFYNITKQYFKKNGEALDVRVDVFSYHSGDADTIGFLGFYQKSPPFYIDYLPEVHPELDRLVKMNNSPGFYFVQRRRTNNVRQSYCCKPPGVF